MVNPAKLTQELLVASIPVEGCASDGRIDFLPQATQAHRDQAAAILAAHDPTNYGAINQNDALSRWAALPVSLKSKSPAEIYAAMQARIDGWSSLAEAKTDLREWLPLIIATLAWTVARGTQE